MSKTVDYEALAKYLKEQASISEIGGFLKEIDKSAERMLTTIEEMKRGKDVKTI